MIETKIDLTNYKVIDGVECVGTFDRNETVSIGYQDPIGDGMEDFFHISDDEVTCWQSLIDHIRETLPCGFTLDTIEVG
jgi:hypothetical protein